MRYKCRHGTVWYTLDDAIRCDLSEIIVTDFEKTKDVQKMFFSARYAMSAGNPYSFEVDTILHWIMTNTTLVETLVVTYLDETRKASENA